MENRRGIILMIISMFAFATADAFIKASAGTIFSTGQIIFLLGVVATPIFALICIYKGQNPLPRSFFDAPVLLRNFGELAGTFGIITSLSLTTISTTSSIQQATPLVVTMGAALILGENVGWRRWSAILFGFFCVLLIIRPGLEGFDANALFAVLGVLGLSVRDLATRKITATVSTMQLSVFGYIILIPLGYLITKIEGQPALLLQNAYGTQAIWFLVGMVGFSMAAYVTITMSVRLGQISAIIPFRYSRLLFALIYGVFLFGERPDWQTLLGAAGIILSGLFLMIRERDIQALPSDTASR